MQYPTSQDEVILSTLSMEGCHDGWISRHKHLPALFLLCGFDGSSAALDDKQADIPEPSWLQPAGWRFLEGEDRKYSWRLHKDNSIRSPFSISYISVCAYCKVNSQMRREKGRNWLNSWTGNFCSSFNREFTKVELYILYYMYTILHTLSRALDIVYKALLLPQVE